MEREDECEETSPHNGQGNEPAPRQCAQRAWLHGGRVDSDGGVGQRCVGRRRAQEGRSVKRLVLVARGTNPWCGVCRFTAPPPGHRRSAGPRMSPVRCGLAAAAAAAAARSRARARSLSQPTPEIVCRASGAGALTDPISMSLDSAKVRPRDQRDAHRQCKRANGQHDGDLRRRQATLKQGQWAPTRLARHTTTGTAGRL